MDYTDINAEMLLIAFLAIYAVLRRWSRTAMMLYVIAFNLYFAYRLNGSLMWLLPATACFNYALTQEMRLREGKTRKMLLATVVVADLSVLAYFKYATFLLDDVIGAVLSTNFSFHAVMLPVGISFYTFQAISYTIDVYRGDVKPTRNMVAFLVFISFFPQLVAGPIERAKNLLPQFLHKKEFDYADRKSVV